MVVSVPIFVILIVMVFVIVFIAVFHLHISYRVPIRYREEKEDNLCWCPLSTSKHVKIKQINIVTFTIFFLTIVIFVFYLAWLCYETREDCYRRWSVRGETEGNCVVSSARTHQCWNEIWTRENSTRGNGKSIYLWPRPHYGEKMWERRLHSDNVSNVFCPHYAGEI